jgi:uncharacterized membrane protein
MVINKKIGIVMALILFVSFISFAVSAFSVSTPYMENKELKLFPGELKDLTFTLQNSAATENVNIRVQIIEGSDLATITDETNIYEIVPGDKVPVHMKIDIPSDFEIGGRHPIKIEFSTQTEEQGGTFGFGTGIEQNFDVVIGKEIKEKMNLNPGYIVALIILLVIIFKIILKKKKKKK